MDGTGAADHSRKGTLHSGAIPVHCQIVGVGGEGLAPLLKTSGPPAPPAPTPLLYL